MAKHEPFIVGNGASGRIYVVHTKAPRFVAELFPDGEKRSKTAIDTAQGFFVDNYVWIDKPTAAQEKAAKKAIPVFLKKMND